MWKQTNLGYLRVDRLGCRLRRLAREGEPSLLDSVLDSTPRENTSVRNHAVIHASLFVGCQISSINSLLRDSFLYRSTTLCERKKYIINTSTRLYWHSITRPGAFAARTSGRVASGALSTRSQFALGFRDARKVALLVPPWCF